jgi:hypothetical protein
MASSGVCGMDLLLLLTLSECYLIKKLRCTLKIITEVFMLSVSFWEVEDGDSSAVKGQTGSGATNSIFGHRNLITLKLLSKKIALRNNNLGKFFSPSASFAGYVLIIAGVLAISYSFVSLVLIIPGSFMAFTYTGTIIDIDNKRVKPYISLFGIFKTGKWIDINQFTRFSIVKVTNNYTSFSRANVRFDYPISNIRLLLIQKEGSLKIVINKFSKFEDARREKDGLSTILFPPGILK